LLFILLHLYDAARDEFFSLLLDFRSLKKRLFVKVCG